MKTPTAHDLAALAHLMANLPEALSAEGRGCHEAEIARLKDISDRHFANYHQLQGAAMQRAFPSPKKKD